MAFLFSRLHSIEMLVSVLTLNQNVFELWLLQLMNGQKARKDEYKE